MSAAGEKLWEQRRFGARQAAEADNRSARDWARILSETDGDTVQTLGRMILQLHFPVERGISQTPDYLSAVRTGTLPESAALRAFHSPEGLRVNIHSTPVGEVVVIEADDDADFLRLLRSIACKNEPVDIPPAQGASLLSGYGNWQRVKLFQSEYLREHPGATTAEARQALRQDPSAYRDTLILLSGRYYSGIAPERIGLPPDQWRRKSKQIRLHHEIAHFMTKRLYGTAANHPHDELVADFMGISTAFPEYSADLFLLFLGLEHFPAYREGGRLEQYLNGLDPEDFHTLGELLVHSARALEKHARRSDRISCFHWLCGRSLLELASENEVDKL